MVIDKILVIASSIIKNTKSQILLLQRSGKSSYSGYWQLVEGKLEKGESLQETLKREVEEETNVSILHLEMNNVFYNEIEAKGLKYLCFRVVFKTTISSENIKTSDEHISFGWFNKEKALKLPLLPGTEEILKNLV